MPAATIQAGGELLRLKLDALCRKVAKCSQLPLDHIDRTDVCTLFSKIKANSLAIVSDQGESLGLGLYPFCSMFNHSDTYAVLTYVPMPPYIFCGEVLTEGQRFPALEPTRAQPVQQVAMKTAQSTY